VSVLHQLNDAYAVYTSSRTKGEVKQSFKNAVNSRYIWGLL